MGSDALFREVAMKHMSAKILLLSLAAFLAAAVPARAQVDLSGSWASRLHEDWQDHFLGPDGGDFTGLPLNDEGRARALSYSTSALSMPERQCLFYPPHYTEIGPFNLKIWSEAEAVTGGNVAWMIGGWTDRAARTIWMDGRPHPSKNAVHTNGGFSTGRWEGNTLVVETTHMKAGYLRRNGVPASDEMTMTEYVSRHGDVLTILAVLDDPIYLSEPLVISRNWQFDAGLVQTSFGGTCVPAVEVIGIGSQGGVVPHYAPGQNPYVGEVTAHYGVPAAAVLGGAETLYPEYRKKIAPGISAPEMCGRYCCGWAVSAVPVGDAPGLQCVSRTPGAQ
jgi:hypothetical protein